MTKHEMLIEMFDKGYATQYSIEWYEENFSEEQIKIFYDKFMDHLKNNTYEPIYK